MAVYPPYDLSKGSLTGFDSVEQPDGSPDLVQTGWSISELKAFLRNERNLTFPNVDAISDFTNLIEQHIADHNNPHDVTLAQIAPDLVESVLGKVIPGTPPDMPPFYVFDSACGLPLGTIVPVSINTTNLYRMNEGGLVVDMGQEDVQIGTDGMSGLRALSLYGTVSNVVLPNWQTKPTTTINTTLVAETLSAYPFPFYQVEETNTTDVFGLSIPCKEDLDLFYTFSCFLQPSAAGGTLQIFQPSTPTKYVTVDLTTGDAVITGGTLLVRTTRYNDGVIRLCVGFVSGLSSADNALQMIHTDSSQQTSRQGTTGRVIFAIAKPAVTQTPINVPVLVNDSLAAGSSPLTLQFNRVPTPATLSSVTIALSMDMEPLPVGSPIVDTAVLAFDALTMTRDGSTLIVKVSNLTVFTSVIQPGLNHWTLSYSPTELVFKDFASDRQTAVGVYPALSTATVTMGPVAGALEYCAFYATPDLTRVVEYLTDG